jgi:hypothetical protein
MLSVRLELNTAQFTRELTALHQRQLPFARSLAINRLGLAFQREERERLARVFTLRRPEFILREAVKRLGPASTKDNPSVVFGVSDRADFLERFEKGERKTPTRGAGHTLAVPQQVRRNQKDIISRGNRPRALLQNNKARKGAGRVFILKEKRGPIGPGVFQTTGRKGRGGLRFLYGLEDSVPTAPVLAFLETARTVAEQQWPSIFEAALAEALRTAR